MQRSTRHLRPRCSADRHEDLLVSLAHGGRGHRKERGRASAAMLPAEQLPRIGFIAVYECGVCRGRVEERHADALLPGSCLAIAKKLAGRPSHSDMGAGFDELVWKVAALIGVPAPDLDEIHAVAADLAAKKADPLDRDRFRLSCRINQAKGAETMRLKAHSENVEFLRLYDAERAAKPWGAASRAYRRWAETKPQSCRQERQMRNVVRQRHLVDEAGAILAKREARAASTIGAALAEARTFSDERLDERDAYGRPTSISFPAKKFSETRLCIGRRRRVSLSSARIFARWSREMDTIFPDVWP